jgi:hypothetical protein
MKDKNRIVLQLGYIEITSLEMGCFGKKVISERGYYY